MVNYTGRMARCARLSGEQHAFCILIGSTSLIAGVAIKVLPESISKKIPRLINERANLDNDPIVKAYKAQAEAKLSTKSSGHKPVQPK